MDISFAIPTSQTSLWAGAALGALVAIGLGLRWLERRRADRMNVFVESQLAPRLLHGVDAGLRRPLFWFTMAGFAFLAAALAQPRWGESWERVSRRSHSIVVCLDVSESMLAENPQPNRLERAKQKTAAIADKAFGDRFGLVAFAGAAELMCPLTLDHGYFRTVLSAVDTESISLEGTDMASAFEVAMATFRDQDAETGRADREARAILLISDGEEVSGDALAAAREAANYARIFVIGVGDPRGTMIEYRNRFAQGVPLRPAETSHLSRLDEATLQRIAVEGHGGYIRATANDSDVHEIFGLIQELFAQDVGGDVEHQLTNRFQWPLALAIACFAAEGAWLVTLPWIGRWKERRRPRRTREADYA